MPKRISPDPGGALGPGPEVRLAPGPASAGGAGLAEVADILATVRRNRILARTLERCERQHERLYRHALACSGLMIALARRLDLSAPEIAEAGMAGLLFDIGISHLPPELAARDGDVRRLPADSAMLHVELGYAALLASGLPESVALAALQHHERDDGSGYPFGLAGGAIPLLSRMAAVCDAWCRSAGARSDPGAAIRAMATPPGRFDPDLLAALAACVGA